MAAKLVATKRLVKQQYRVEEMKNCLTQPGFTVCLSCSSISSSVSLQEQSFSLGTSHLCFTSFLASDIVSTLTVLLSLISRWPSITPRQVAEFGGVPLGSIQALTALLFFLFLVFNQFSMTDNRVPRATWRILICYSVCPVWYVTRLASHLTILKLHGLSSAFSVFVL